jgi:integrase
MVRPSSVPKYRKHSSGSARVTLNGRDYLLGPWQSKTSIREYDRIVAEYLASGRSPSFGIEADAYTVAMLIRDYLRHCKAYYGTDKTSELHRIKPAIKPLVSLYADHDAAEFGPVGYKAVRQVMIESGLSRQGVNARMKKVVRAFKWGASEGKLPAAVFGTLSLIPSLKMGRTTAPDTESVTPVDDEVVERTVGALSPIVADMVRVQRLLGCRPGEVCNLTPASFDRSDDVWVATLIEHKTAHHGHARKLFVGPKAQAILTPYLFRDDDMNLFRPCDAVAMRRQRDAAGRTTPLSCGNRPGRKYDRGGLKGKSAKKAAGDAYTTESYRRAIHNACDRAFPAPAPLAQHPGESDRARHKRLTTAQLEELKVWQSSHRWGPNRLRHAKGTEVRKALGLEAAQVTLGHRKADVTQIYAQRDEELAKQVARHAG